ncbi:FUSC family protein [Pallidibacillus pasinlerensis]|uniref:Aromatic acid exporter family protein n=1 Tax=Pallidibacillus pasinlerensis TaxID=2703818 RepID=A0ABX0A6K2_9BACI|nr:aromatic acid exporter family protein [Pallidibacillus pasinlerensis]NCU19077.1 aromatic acid exporter family protein [Pallidibacillus pasinlerensis]
MKLGARIFKTGLAVVLALMLGDLLNLPSPVFAAIAAVFAIQPSIYRSYLTILEQVQGNVVGAIVAIVFGLLFGNHFIIVGLAAIIVIMINLRLKIDTISLSIVTLIVVMESPPDEFIMYSLLRFGTILLGILSAFLINLIFIPPKYETKLYQSISDLSNDVLKWMRLAVHQAADLKLLKKEIESLNERFVKLEDIYLFYKEEKTFLKKESQTKMRKLVIYRQMITTGKSALELLKKQHHYEYEIINTDENTAQNLKEIIQHLNNNHEHLLLRYIGKAIQIHDEEMQEYEEIRERLLDVFKNYQRNSVDDEIIPHVLQFVAGILEYNEQLERLEVLLNNVEQFHKDEKHADFAEELS